MLHTIYGYDSRQELFDHSCILDDYMWVLTTKSSKIVLTKSNKTKLEHRVAVYDIAHAKYFLFETSLDDLSKFNLNEISQQYNKKFILIYELGGAWLDEYSHNEHYFYVKNKTHDAAIAFCQAVLNTIPLEKILKEIKIESVTINRHDDDDEEQWLSSVTQKPFSREIVADEKMSYEEAFDTGKKLPFHKCMELFNVIKENWKDINAINFASIQEGNIEINHETKELENIQEFGSSIAMLCAWIKHCMNH